MDVSILICTWNNDKRLDKTLEYICGMRVSKEIEWEVVAVDNNSTDSTKEVIQSFDNLLPIKYVYEPVQGLARAHNAGLDVVKGDLILFTDDDVEPSQKWLMAYWEAYQDRKEGYYFGGAIESEYEGKPPDEDLMRVAFPSVAGLDLGLTAHEVSAARFIGPNWACPSKYLEQAGEFDEKLGLNPAKDGVGVGEETDMMNRLEKLGIRGWYVPGAKIKHFVPESKCTLDHITSRATAGLENAYGPDSPTPFTLLGIPVGLYKGAILSWTEWILRRSVGMKWKKEYVSWIKHKKLIQAYRKSRQ